jgi:hypothetical protein
MQLRSTLKLFPDVVFSSKKKKIIGMYNSASFKLFL